MKLEKYYLKIYFLQIIFLLRIFIKFYLNTFRKTNNKFYYKILFNYLKAEYKEISI